LNFGPALPLEEISMMVEHLEMAAIVVAGILALGWFACEWRA
jgi:hypothetical protein